MTATSAEKIIIYIKPSCPFCVQAKRLLDKYQLPYAEIDLIRNPERRPEMIEKANGRTTVPQIFFGSEHVGGYTDLAKLEATGQLE